MCHNRSLLFVLIFNRWILSSLHSLKCLKACPLLTDAVVEHYKLRFSSPPFLGCFLAEASQFHSRTVGIWSLIWPTHHSLLFTFVKLFCVFYAWIGRQPHSKIQQLFNACITKHSAPTHTLIPFFNRKPVASLFYCHIVEVLLFSPLHPWSDIFRVVVPFPTVVYRKCSLFSLSGRKWRHSHCFHGRDTPNEPSNSNRGAIYLEKWKIIAVIR